MTTGEKNQVFEGLVANSFTGVSLSGGGEPEQIPAEIVSPDYFQVLGAPIAVGRAFLPDEERIVGAAPITVISHGLWQRRFGGDRGIVGKEITLNGRAFTVVGIAAEGFRGPTRLAVVSCGCRSRCTAKPSAALHWRTGIRVERCSFR